MLKNSRSVSVDLRRRRSYISLGRINPQSFVIIGMIVLMLLISVLCIAAYPNSNVLSSI